MFSTKTRKNLVLKYFGAIFCCHIRFKKEKSQISMGFGKCMVIDNDIQLNAYP